MKKNQASDKARWKSVFFSGHNVFVGIAILEKRLIDVNESKRYNTNDYRAVDWNTFNIMSMLETN